MAAPLRSGRRERASDRLLHRPTSIATNILLCAIHSSVTMRRSHTAVLLAAGCLGVILAALLLFPAVYAMVFPALPAGGAGAPGNASVPDGEPENGTFLLSATDDERLESLIAGASIPLLELSVAQIHALHTHDDAALRDQAVETVSCAESLRSDAVVLEVSPENEFARSHFIAALDEFAAAGTLLSRGIPMNRSVTEDALDRLALGTERLADALEACSRPPVNGPETVLVSPVLTTAPAPEFPDAMQLGGWFHYDDARGENAASLVVERVTWSRTFWTSGTKPVEYSAGPGMTYLQVALRAAHLGHKGNGVNTRIQTPAESTFTLHSSQETYHPLASPGPTNQGGSYSRVYLGRNEVVTGYLFFEVPEDFDPAGAYLEVTLGKERPVWRLGGTP